MKTVVLLSGGLDSAVALALTLAEGDTVEALTVDYGQVHQMELHAAARIASHYQIPQVTVRVDPALFGNTSALMNPHVELPDKPAEQPDATYVPARNTVLLAMAAARAEVIGARSVVIGCNADDAGGYPDCRRDYIAAFRDVLNTGTLGHVWVHTPLLYQTKAQVVKTAIAQDVPTQLTWSCYDNLAAGQCGHCGACLLREQAMA